MIVMQAAIVGAKLLRVHITLASVMHSHTHMLLMYKQNDNL